MVENCNCRLVTVSVTAGMLSVCVKVDTTFRVMVVGTLAVVVIMVGTLTETLSVRVKVVVILCTDVVETNSVNVRKEISDTMTLARASTRTVTVERMFRVTGTVTATVSVIVVLIGISLNRVTVEIPPRVSVGTATDKSSAATFACAPIERVVMEVTV